jgi:uncharacterized protein with PIN domain
MQVDPSEEIRFVADKMLGRLARWLRVMGRDVKYGTHLSGRGLLKEARREKRWILTRDRRLARTKNPPPTLLIQSHHFREQLKEVLKGLPFDPLARALTRCIECNQLLSPVPKKDVEARVPPYVFSSKESFVLCKGCHKVYWPATHRERMLEELKRIVQDMDTEFVQGS